MADKRMFCKEIIDSDAFVGMPISTQALYFHLCMRADDDGFVNSPIKIQRMIGSFDTDMDVLKQKRYILSFESGVIVIKHWGMHNTIPKDRYKATVYQEEFSNLALKSNKSYTEKNVIVNENPEPCLQNMATLLQETSFLETQIRLDKNRLDKNKDIVLFEESVKEIISYLNTKSGTNYKSSSTRTKKFIHARLEDGFIVDNFKKVIDIKCSQWLNDEKMSIYLRPETLFGAKFESYLNEKEVKGSKSKFNQIEKSNYDMELLEKELLEN